jgi:hypothetical protein
MAASTISTLSLQDCDTMIPHTDWERLALLEEIECGEKIVVPVSLEHAKFMIMVAQAYINQNKQEMWEALQQ